MKLTGIQKAGTLFFICSLFVAYCFANWRHEATSRSLGEMFQKEQALHLSTDKLLSNCEELEARNAASYNPAHKICNQGTEVHARTDQTMQLLQEAKNATATQWYRNFFLAAIFLNLVGFLLYQANAHLQREED